MIAAEIVPERPEEGGNDNGGKGGRGVGGGVFGCQKAKQPTGDLS